MWNGKTKAITFSFDDGVTQDIRAIELLNKYNVKATFNINSSRFGEKFPIQVFGCIFDHNKIEKSDFKKIYQGHEIAGHTKTHPMLPTLTKDEIIDQVEHDRLILSDLCCYEVIGMAYPGGGVNNDDRVAEIVKNNTGIKYARTTTSTYNFDIQNNLYRFNPTVRFVEKDKLFELGKKFIELKTNTPQLFYVWGHTYEMDAKTEKSINWQEFEELLKLISNKSDIFYGTNKEVLL